MVVDYRTHTFREYFCEIETSRQTDSIQRYLFFLKDLSNDFEYEYFVMANIMERMDNNERKDRYERKDSDDRIDSDVIHDWTEIDRRPDENDNDKIHDELRVMAT